MTSLADVVVRDANGTQIRLGDVIDRPTIVDRVRYYGCAPCRQFLQRLAEHAPTIEAAGGQVIAVGPRAAHQARALEEALGVSLYLDPHHHLAETIGQPRMSLVRFVLDVRGWWRWLRTFWRQRAITGGWWELPAVLVVDAEAEIQWAYFGRYLGDYPPLPVVLERLERLAS